MSELDLYTYAVQAIRETQTPAGKEVTFSSQALLFEGKPTQNELMEMAYEVFPPREGWGQHRWSGAVIARSHIRRVVASWMR